MRSMRNTRRVCIVPILTLALTIMPRHGAQPRKRRLASNKVARYPAHQCLCGAPASPCVRRVCALCCGTMRFISHGSHVAGTAQAVRAFPRPIPLFSFMNTSAKYRSECVQSFSARAAAHALTMQHCPNVAQSHASVLGPLRGRRAQQKAVHARNEPHAASAHLAVSVQIRTQSTKAQRMSVKSAIVEISCWWTVCSSGVALWGNPNQGINKGDWVLKRLHELWLGKTQQSVQRRA